MIGWINLSIEEFITESFGADKWKEVLEKSKVDSNWVSSCPYADKVTYE
jgi:guanylate cyclase soluble subunit beta